MGCVAGCTSARLCLLSDCVFICALGVTIALVTWILGGLVGFPVAVGATAVFVFGLVVCLWFISYGWLLVRLLISVRAVWVVVMVGGSAFGVFCCFLVCGCDCGCCCSF